MTNLETAAQSNDRGLYMTQPIIWITNMNLTSFQQWWMPACNMFQINEDVQPQMMMILDLHISVFDRGSVRFSCLFPARECYGKLFITVNLMYFQYHYHRNPIQHFPHMSQYKSRETSMDQILCIDSLSTGRHDNNFWSTYFKTHYTE